MAKRPKCEHGFTPVKYQGCAQCCMRMGQGANLLRILDIPAEHVLAILKHHYKTGKELKAAGIKCDREWAAREAATAARFLKGKSKQSTRPATGGEVGPG